MPFDIKLLKTHLLLIRLHDMQVKRVFMVLDNNICCCTRVRTTLWVEMYTQFGLTMWTVHRMLYSSPWPWVPQEQSRNWLIFSIYLYPYVPCGWQIRDWSMDWRFSEEMYAQLGMPRRNANRMGCLSPHFWAPIICPNDECWNCCYLLIWLYFFFPFYTNRDKPPWYIR